MERREREKREIAWWEGEKVRGYKERERKVRQYERKRERDDMKETESKMV